MSRTSLFFIITLSFLSLNFDVFSQNSDAGMWNTFSIEKKINKQFSIAVDEEIRFKENYTRLNLLYTNLGLVYRPDKSIKIALIYRLIEKYEPDDYFSYRNRLMLDLSYKYKLRKISLSYRSRFQSEVRNYYSSDKGKIPEWFWRNKFELKYNLKKYSPYLGTELRYQFTDPRNPESDYGWHRIRMFAGIDYKIDNSNTFGIYYLVQREWMVTDPQNLYILGLEYSLELP